ncbi:MAG: hypothetical protein Q9198_006589 [Flavoplaca austrocitrina]
MCAINIGTNRKGTKCHADVTCQDGGTRNYDDWEDCRHLRKNSFNDPRIGPFTIMWTEKDDKCNDGLCRPILALEHIDNYRELDVKALADEASGQPERFPEPTNICDKTPMKQEYVCGMPKIGHNYEKGNLNSQPS